jgi:hypothetical protein
MTFVIASDWEGWTLATRRFAMVSLLVGGPSLLVSLFYASLKWAELWD